MYKEVLLNLLKEHALKTGDFTLKSGRKSNYLIDCKKVVLSAKGHVLVGEVMYSMLPAIATAVAGVELGGCPLASAVSYCSASRSQPVQAIYVRKQQKDHGSKSLIEGAGNLDSMPVVVLEDVTTTAGSAMFAVQQLWKYGANVLGVLTLVDRQEGAREALEKEGVKLWSVFTKKDFGV